MGSFISTIIGGVYAKTQAGLAAAQPFRPPQWSQPAMVAITVPPQTDNAAQTIQPNPDVPGGAILQNNSAASTTYVFDAVMHLEHDQQLVMTRHPIQNGADISSHAYLQPAQLVLYVGMSDAMDSYASTASSAKPPYYTPFTGNSSKSVSAYQQMISLQAARVPLTVTTRLRTYSNMLVESVSPREDHKTIAGLRMRVVFQELRTAAVSVQPISARPADTQQTGLGQVNSKSVSDLVTKQFNVLEKITEFTGPITVPGAGAWSSVNTNSLTQLPPPVGGGS